MPGGRPPVVVGGARRRRRPRPPSTTTKTTPSPPSRRPSPSGPGIGSGGMEAGLDVGGLHVISLVSVANAHPTDARWSSRGLLLFLPIPRAFSSIRGVTQATFKSCDVLHPKHCHTIPIHIIIHHHNITTTTSTARLIFSTPQIIIAVATCHRHCPHLIHH